MSNKELSRMTKKELIEYISFLESVTMYEDDEE